MHGAAVAGRVKRSGGVHTWPDPHPGGAGGVKLDKGCECRTGWGWERGRGHRMPAKPRAKAAQSTPVSPPPRWGLAPPIHRGIAALSCPFPQGVTAQAGLI